MNQRGKDLYDDIYAHKDKVEAKSHQLPTKIYPMTSREELFNLALNNMI